MRDLNPAVKHLLFCLLTCFSTAVHAAGVIQLEAKKGRIIRLPYPPASVFVADNTIADVDIKSPQVLYLYGKAVGETTLHALDENENTLLNRTITVTHNTRALATAIRRALPEVKAEVQSMNGGLVLSGYAPSPDTAEKVRAMATAFVGDQGTVIDTLEVGGSDQVMLRVRIAEVSRSQVKQFGINIDSLLNRGGFLFGLATGRGLFDEDGLFVRNNNNIRIGSARTDGSIEGVIDALATEGLVNILAEPTLTAKSGESANFLAGGEFPIPVPGDGGEITIEYKQFGVQLAFTPTVLAENRISLAVSPEVSSISSNGAVSFNGFTIPSLLTRRTETVVELGSGESFAIAGLLKKEYGDDLSKFPGLGDVPIIGTLFRSTSFQQNESELVVLVTPYIVRGVKNPNALATPMDGYEPASTTERIFEGKLHKEKTPGNITTPPLARHLSGPVGFALGE